MSDRIICTGEAPRQADGAPLVPALTGCLPCRTIQMVAAPRVGICPECGGPLSVLERTSAPFEMDESRRAVA